MSLTFSTNEEFFSDLEKKFNVEKADTSTSDPNKPGQHPDTFVMQPGATQKDIPNHIEPPYSFQVLADLYENSNALRQNIDAMVTNIDGNGWTLRPTIDLDSDEAFEKVKDILLQRNHANTNINLEEADLDTINNLIPTDEEVKDEIEKLKILSRLERSSVEKKIKYISTKKTFIDLRKDTRRDLELFGNASWEVIRDEDGRIKQIVYVPWINMKLLPVEKSYVDVNLKIKKNEIDFEEVPAQKRFRRYVQISKKKKRKTYFKEYGDPRVMSFETGKFYETVEELEKEEGAGKEANEIYHWEISSPVSAYGMPRWIGNLLSVLGSRAAEEVNYYYFDNSSIPPLAILVEDGRLTQESINSLKDFFKHDLKGRDNFHEILILEGEPFETADATNPGEIQHTGTVKVDFKPLTEAQLNEALFTDYDSRNIQKVGESFRIPPILRGDTKDFNRSTAQVAKAFAEEQVFQPERDAFDSAFNRFFLNDWGVKFWEIESKAPINRDPVVLTNVISRLALSGVLTPSDGRSLAEDILNKRLKKIPYKWADVPQEMARAFAQQGALADVLGFEDGILPERPVSEEDPEPISDRVLQETSKQEDSVSAIVIPLPNSRKEAIQEIFNDKEFNNLEGDFKELTSDQFIQIFSQVGEEDE